MEPIIRRARLEDWPTVAEFNCRLARETEGRELDRTRVEAGVRAALSDPSRGCYYLAEVDGEVAGQLMITREWSDWRDGWFWWIQSLYVDARYRGRGVCRRLFDHVRAEAAADGNVVGLRLYVEEHNAGAQRVYERLGMEPGRYRFYEREFSPPGPEGAC